MLLIGTKNTSNQVVLTDGMINIGNAYRRYCKRTSAGLPTFSNTANGITLNGQGIYHVTATFVGSGTEAGVLAVQLMENGNVATDVMSAESITTPETELRTLVIDYYSLVTEQCLLGCTSVLSNTISFKNTGIGATFDSVIVNVEKVV